jgi:hypothetical protein
MDPSSEAYYLELERRTAARFPERWEAMLREQRAASSSSASASAASGSSAAVGSPASRAAPLAPVDKVLPPAAELSAVQAFSRAIKAVTLKDPLPHAASSAPAMSSGGVGSAVGAEAAAGAGPLHGFRNFNSGAGTSVPLAAVALGGSYAAAAGRQQRASTSDSSSPSKPSTAGSQAAVVRASASSSFNPFNLAAANPAPPKARQPAPARAAKRGGRGGPAGPASAAAASPGSPMAGRRAAAAGGNGGTQSLADQISNPFEFTSFETMQQEYLKQRAMVLSELREAKEQAELERAKIMAKISRALHGNAAKWRK